MAKGDKKKAINKFVEEKRDVAQAKVDAKADGKVTKSEKKEIRQERKEFKQAKKDLKQDYGKGAIKQAKKQYKKKYPNKPIASDPSGGKGTKDAISNSRIGKNRYIAELFGFGREEIDAQEQDQYAANLYRNFEAITTDLVANVGINEVDQIPVTLAISAIYKDDDRQFDYDNILGLQEVDSTTRRAPINMTVTSFEQTRVFGRSTSDGFVPNAVKNNPDGSIVWDMKVELPDISGAVDYRVDILEVQ